MNGVRAGLAIVRHQMDARFWCLWLAHAAAGFLFVFLPWQRVENVWDLALVVWLTLAFFLAMPSDTRPGAFFNRRQLLDLKFFAAPLYGRQLARAQSVAPCVAACAFIAGSLAGLMARGFGLLVIIYVAPLVAATIVAELISLSAVMREGRARLLYRGLAFGGGFTVILALALPPSGALTLACATSTAVVLGFFALRAFGETLARYDPIE